MPRPWAVVFSGSTFRGQGLRQHGPKGLGSFKWQRRGISDLVFQYFSCAVICLPHNLCHFDKRLLRDYIY